MKSPFIVLLMVLFVPAGVSAAEMHHILEVETGYLFGATAGKEWIKSDKAAKSFKTGAVLSVYGLGARLGETIAQALQPLEDVCPEVVSVELSPKPAGAAIALAAPWNGLPRPVQKADTTQKVYINAVADFLRGRGIKDPQVKITQILRADLEGDGEEEVLVSATNHLTDDPEALAHGPRPGSYSFVILRRVVGGKVRTQFVAGEFHPATKGDGVINVYEVSAILDLNGDGKMEVVVHSAYYEGATTTIYECRPEKIKPLLEVACGV